MPSRRTSVAILILIGGISAAAGIFGNVAASALPTDWQPYLWLAWPLFILFTAAGIGLAVWQVRQDQRAHSPAQPQPTDPPTALSATATPPNPLPSRPTRLPVSQSTSLPAQGPAGNDFDYDVFISYSSADKTWVRGELLSALEQAGLRVCIDFRDFQPGAPRVTEMERAVQTSRRTLLVLTPAYLASAWTEFEALMLQTLDAANRQRRLIPLLLERCDLPLRIGYLTYVNFVDPDDPAWAWTQLLTALGAAALRSAEAKLRLEIALCREIEDEFQEAVGHQELGRLLAYRGAWDEAEGELAAALAMFEKHKNVQSQGIVWAYRALRALLLMRAIRFTPNPVRSPLSDSAGSPPEGEGDRRRSSPSLSAEEGVRGELAPLRCTPPAVRWSWRSRRPKTQGSAIRYATTCAPTGCSARPAGPTATPTPPIAT